MTTWVVVADNSRARFFSAEKPASPLSEVMDLAHPESRLREGELVTDKSGRDRNPARGAHGVGSEDTHKQEEAERFALMLCDELEKARNADRFHKLYIVAAPAFLGLLRKHQSPGVRQRIVQEIDKNLTTHDPTAIRSHLPKYL